MFFFVRPIAVLMPALLAFGLSGGFAGSALAQEAAKPAVAPHCGGLICDAYYAGIPAGQPAPTSLPCRDFVCGFFGGRTPEQPVAAAEPAPAAPAPSKPAKVKKRVAKAARKPAEVAEKPVEAAAK